jgi:hypothetical protein
MWKVMSSFDKRSAKVGDSCGKSFYISAAGLFSETKV